MITALFQHGSEVIGTWFSVMLRTKRAKKVRWGRRWWIHERKL